MVGLLLSLGIGKRCIARMAMAFELGTLWQGIECLERGINSLRSCTCGV